MERKEQSPPDGPPQAAKGEDDQSSEEKRAMVALARILGAGPLVGGSLRLLEQLADYVQCPQEGVPRETAPAKQAAAQRATSVEEEPAETAPAETPTRERETSASGQLTAPEAAGRRETKEPCPMETAESTGARDINVPGKETATVRRDGEPLTNAAKRRRQTESETRRGTTDGCGEAAALTCERG